MFYYKIIPQKHFLGKSSGGMDIFRPLDNNSSFKIPTLDIKYSMSVVALFIGTHASKTKQKLYSSGYKV